jgi:hypothetical protein
MEYLEALTPPPEQKMLPPDYRFKRSKVRRTLKRVKGGTVKGGVFTPKRSLDVPRAEMPQLKSREDFVHWLQNQGVNVSIQYISPQSLIRKNGQKLTAHGQSNIYLDKAMKFIQRNTLLKKLIVLTQDGIIFDGNHHWYALMAVAPKKEVPMYVVDMPFYQLKQLTVQSYPSVSFEDWLFVRGLLFAETNLL